MDELARTRSTAKLATHAKKAFIGGLCGLCVCLGPAARAAAPPVRTMYADALAREQAIRVALADPDAPLKLEEVRTLVRAYEAIVRHGRVPISLFGLAFKQGTDDLRESPFVRLAEWPLASR